MTQQEKTNPAPVSHVVGYELSQDSNHQEQRAFEAWASSHGYVMHEHPLHYLFMDPKTDAARQGWKAALQYARKQFATTEGQP